MTHYDEVRQAFDRLAPDYDRLYGTRDNPAFGRLRAESLKLLEELFPPGAWLLDIGCGTGEEAVALAKKGCRVWGVDLSAEMVERARERARREGVDTRVTFHVLPAYRVGELLGEVPPERLAGAYSSFGVMNLEPNLAAVRDGLTRLIKPSGRLVIGVRNRFSLLDAVSSVATRGHGAGKETDRPWEIPVPEGAIHLSARYYDPDALAAEFRPGFSRDRLFPLSVLSQSSARAHLLKRFEGVLGSLSRFESLLTQSRAGAHVADQFILTFLRETADLEGRPHGPHWLANG